MTTSIRKPLHLHSTTPPLRETPDTNPDPEITRTRDQSRKKKLLGHGTRVTQSPKKEGRTHPVLPTSIHKRKRRTPPFSPVLHAYREGGPPKPRPNNQKGLPSGTILLASRDHITFGKGKERVTLHTFLKRGCK